MEFFFTLLPTTLSLMLCEIRECKLHKLTSCTVFPYQTIFEMLPECDMHCGDIEHSVWLLKVLLNNMKAIVQWSKRQTANGWHELCIQRCSIRRKNVLFASWEVITPYFILDGRNTAEWCRFDGGTRIHAYKCAHCDFLVNVAIHFHSKGISVASEASDAYFFILSWNFVCLIKLFAENIIFSRYLPV